MGDGLIGEGECFLDTILRQDEFAHAIVVKKDECIRALLEELERFFSLIQTTAAFKTERHGGKDDDQSTDAFGNLSDHRCRTRSGAATEARADEDDLMAEQSLADLLFGKQGRLATEVGVSACADALHQVSTELHFLRSHPVIQHPDVRVKAGEVCFH